MFDSDPKEFSRCARAATARLILVQPKDPGETSVGDPAPYSAGNDGEHSTVPGPSAPANPADVPSNTSRAGTAAGPSGRFGALSQMFRRSRVAPLRTRSPDPPAPTPSQRTGAGRGNRKRWFACPWTSQSNNASRTAESNRAPRRRPCVLRSNRVGPIDDQAAMPSRGLGMHRTAAGANLDQSLQDILPEKSPPKLLGRLASLFSCCTGKRGGPTLGRSPASNPSRQETRDQEEPVGQTTEVTSRSPSRQRTQGSEKVGCCPHARPATVAPAKSPVFWVGSRDDSAQSNLSEGDDMGQAQPTARANTLRHQNHQNLKTVAHKQTIATAEDIRKATLELLSGSQSKPLSNEPPEQIEDDGDEYAGAPSIVEKDLRSVNKERRGPLILGRGQSGVVRLMRYRKPAGGSSLVAVKRFVGSSAHSHKAMAREIRALRAVEHCPIFPKLVGIISDQSFAQEFIGDPKSLQTLSIFQVIRQRKPSISVGNWAWILCDVIMGLSALHRSGWAHCDVQSNNVLLWRNWSNSGESKERWHGRIIDLGNAKRLTGPTSHCLTLTPTEKADYYRHCRHIAPEVVEGLAPYGVRSDVFGLGVLMSDIAHRIPAMSGLIPLANACLVAGPEQRPVLDSLVIELDVWCIDHTGQGFSPAEQNYV